MTRFGVMLLVGLGALWSRWGHASIQAPDSLQVERCQFWRAPDTVIVQGWLLNMGTREARVRAEATVFDSLGKMLGQGRGFRFELVFGRTPRTRGTRLFSVTVEVKGTAARAESVAVLLRDTTGAVVRVGPLYCPLHRARG